MNESKTLNADSLYAILKKVLPAKNDFAENDYKEELVEVMHFGIKTEDQLEALLLRHQASVLELDAKPFQEDNELFYRNEYGDEAIDKAKKDGFWYAFPALLRLALELEFGEKYIEFANSGYQL